MEICAYQTIAKLIKARIWKARRGVVPLRDTIGLIVQPMFTGRDESRYSLILNWKFCACVMPIRGVPQLQVIYMEHSYGCE